MKKLHILYDGQILNSTRTGDTAEVAVLTEKQAAFYDAGRGHPNHQAEWARRKENS